MPSPTLQSTTHVLLLFFLLALIGVRLYMRQLHRRLLPPGPAGWPILGNILDIPSKFGWLKYASMAVTHGDIIYMEALGQPLVILNSFHHANELLEKRSSNYSDRPYSTMLHSLMGWWWNVGLMEYGDRWRRRRRLFHNYFHPSACLAHYDTQYQANKTMLASILHDPSRFFDHVRNFSGSTILKAVYGYDVKSGRDPLVELAEETLEAFNVGTSGGSYMIDVFPFLQYLPDWFPGTGSWRTLARRSNILTLRILNEPFDTVKSLLNDNKAVPCMTVKYLLEIEDNKSVEEEEPQENVIREATAFAYSAGADTAASAILTFILAMTLYPEVQKRAQAELDLIVGSDRLPTFDDKPDLPYVRAVVSEILRWKPIAAGGVGHSSVKEDFYEGYRIPAGTIVTPNVWAILHDPIMYPNPETFNPERFIQRDGEEVPLDPAYVAFGFGRRICPGRYFAQNNILLAVSSILAMFSISKAIDANGREITPRAEVRSGLITYPKEFKCKIVPRRDNALDLIQFAACQ